MQFGAMNFPIQPVIAEIDWIAKLGFDYLELAMDPPKAHWEILQSQRAHIRRKLQDQGLGLVCHLPTFVSIADLTPGIRQASLKEMCQSLETAQALGAEKAVFHPGAVRGMGHFVPDVARGYGLESLDVITRLAADLALPLCIENMFPGYGAYFEADEYAVLFDRYPDLRMTLDTGHAHIGATDGSRLRHFAERYGHRVDHVHISDNSGYADEHLPPGMGSIDYQWLVKSLKAAGFDATVTFEVFTGNPGDLLSSRNWFMRVWDL